MLLLTWYDIWYWICNVRHHDMRYVSSRIGVYFYVESLLRRDKLKLTTLVLKAALVIRP